MNKLVVILLIVAVAAALVMMAMYQQEKKLRVAAQQELDITHRYIRSLQQDVIPREATATDIQPAEAPNTTENIPTTIPVKGDFAISQRYSAAHPAVDFAAPRGAEVVASADGEVASVYQDAFFGNVVLVDHLNKYLTMYAHLAATFVQEGDAVNRGQTIGLVGNTGNSTAPHLHFQILVHGEEVDPLTLLDIPQEGE